MEWMLQESFMFTGYTLGWICQPDCCLSPAKNPERPWHPGIL